MNNISRIIEIIANGGSLKENLGINDEVVKIYDILSKYTKDEEILVASVMQNSISANYSYEKLTSDYGANVADIVANVSKYIHHESVSERWQLKNNIFLKKLEVLKPKPSMIITAYEKHKLSSALSDYRKNGLVALKNTERNMLKYYDRFLTILAQRQAEFRLPNSTVVGDFNYDIVKALSDIRTEAREEIIVKNFARRIFDFALEKKAEGL